jgi:sugar lactone lactonase YvrE
MSADHQRRPLTAAILLGIALFSSCDRTDVETFVEGSPLHGANGIIVDAQGRLNIASVAGREIVVMDRESGAIVDRIGPERGVEGPDDLIFDADGTLYWTSLLTGEVGRLSPDGEKRGQMVSPGVNPITISDDGRLFVALDFLGDALYELDPALEEPPRLIAENLGWMNGMDWGPDGFLYGPIWTEGLVARVNVETGVISPVAEGFGVPAAVKFDSRGRLHVLDTERGEIVRVDRATGSKEILSTAVVGGDNLAFDSSDRLFVSSWMDGSIVEVLSDGSARTVSPGGVMAPGGIAVLSSGSGESVFVADLLSLKEIDGTTGEIRSVAPSMIGLPGIESPFTVAADGDNLILSSWFGSIVQVWNPRSSEVVEAHPIAASPLNAIRFEGDLVVAELQTASVVRITGPNETDRVTLASGLGVPAGLAASNGNLWVADQSAGTILQVVSGGEVLSDPRPVATNLQGPEGLAAANEGVLYVVEAGVGRLSRVDVATGEVSPVADDLALGAPGIPGMPPTWIFNGVAIGPSGAIYVTGDVRNIVYRIQPAR